MKIIKDQMMAGWANFPQHPSTVFFPENEGDAVQSVLENPQILARGNGKSYGDAALANTLLSTQHFNKILHFDAENGMLSCEAGVLLEDILKKTVPLGWFFHVTPGIKAITVGGAIASDVHGKNHPTAGCFSNYLQFFELLKADGEVVFCSKNENAPLFWQTCGGMGWTGIILRATFQMRKVQSNLMRQKTTKTTDIDGVFSAFEAAHHWEYNAAWIDALSKGKSLGRGILYSAEHDKEPSQVLDFQEKRKLNVPFYFPAKTLNSLSIGLYNNFLYHKSSDKEEKVGLDAYFYPLDSIKNWNRLYGRGGFVQYQFCLPQELAYEGIKKILTTIHRSPESPFLTVLKRHGERPSEALHSFPIKGYSLALDFPKTKTIFKLISQLDELVWDCEGKIYLTKDSCSAPRMGRVDPAAFGDAKFFSLLKGRILRNLS